MNTVNDKLRVIGFSVPTSYAERVAAIARRERRTKRSVFQAMVDLYEATQQKEQAFRDMVMKTLAETEQEKQDNPKTMEELLREFRQLSEEGRKEAEALGIDVEDEEAINNFL